MDSRLSPIEGRTVQIEHAWKTHIPSFLNAMASVPSIAHEVTTLARRLDERAEPQPQGISDEISARSEKLETTLAALVQRIDAMDVHGKHADAAIGAIWQRIEFVRREILFEFNHGSEKAPPNGTGKRKKETRIISS
ncbi:hypothetical protein, partial [Mesorhizobium sp. B2-4-3]